MCTLIVAVRAFRDVELLVAANRDERRDRPARPPALLPPSDRCPRRVLAPLDERAGGTWLGINQAGLFAGLTNRFGPVPPDPARRTRGELVFAALAADGPAEAARSLGDLAPEETNRFHLIIADRRSAWVVVHDDRTVRAEELGAGLHVLTERSFGAASTERADWLKVRIAPHLGGPAPGPETFATWLGHHRADDPFSGTCVHFDAWNYGTRSQTQLRLGAPGSAGGFWHTEGSPCTTRAEDRTDLLVDLFAT